MIKHIPLPAITGDTLKEVLRLEPFEYRWLTDDIVTENYEIFSVVQIYIKRIISRDFEY